MDRDLLRAQCYALDAALFSDYEGRTLQRALLQRHTALQVRQGEGGLTVAAVGRADQDKKRIVFRDRKKLPVTKHPAARIEIPREHPDLTNVRLSHNSPLVLRGKDPLQSDADVQHKKR